MFALDNEDGVLEKLNCEVRCGSQYAAEHGVSQIDFLKRKVDS